MQSKLHVGIILDGNRRYAKKLMMHPWEGHKVGMNKVEELMNWCKDLDIRELTLYCFSMQNFQRDKTEVKFLMEIFDTMLTKLLSDPRVDEDEVNVKFLGRISLFPKNLQDIMIKIMEKTKNHAKFQLNLAMGYGGQEEIVDAVKKIGEEIKDGKIKPSNIDVETVRENLYLQNYPDFIIRTGGAMRTSNFLMWQSAYSEWFFPKKTWPEMTKEDLVSFIEEFRNERERRFGK